MKIEIPSYATDAVANALRDHADLARRAGGHRVAAALVAAADQVDAADSGDAVDVADLSRQFDEAVQTVAALRAELERVTAERDKLRAITRDSHRDA